MTSLITTIRHLRASGYPLRNSRHQDHMLSNLYTQCDCAPTLLFVNVHFAVLVNSSFTYTVTLAVHSVSCQLQRLLDFRLGGCPQVAFPYTVAIRYRLLTYLKFSPFDVGSLLSEWAVYSHAPPSAFRGWKLGAQCLAVRYPCSG